MWISDKWEDYRLLDCGRGEKLECWGPYTLIRPDPKPSGTPPEPIRPGKNTQPDTAARPPVEASGRKTPCLNAGRSAMIDLTFHIKPMNFKHTGLFPEQAANWDLAGSRSAGPAAYLGTEPVRLHWRSHHRLCVGGRQRLPCGCGQGDGVMGT